MKLDVYDAAELIKENLIIQQLSNVTHLEPMIMMVTPTDIAT